jgi:hypothetical protein
MTNLFRSECQVLIKSLEEMSDDLQKIASVISLWLGPTDELTEKANSIVFRVDRLAEGVTKRLECEHTDICKKDSVCLDCGQDFRQEYAGRSYDEAKDLRLYGP